MADTYSGKILESAIAGILKQARVTYLPQHKTGCLDPFGSEVVVDFYLPNLSQFEYGLYLESKRQESEGSVKEKLLGAPRKYENIDRPVVMIFMGKPLDVAIPFLQSNGINVLKLDDLVRFIEHESPLSWLRARPYNSDQREMF